MVDRIAEEVGPYMSGFFLKLWRKGWPIFGQVAVRASQKRGVRFLLRAIVATKRPMCSTHRYDRKLRGAGGAGNLTPICVDNSRLAKTGSSMSTC
jgi:hypothetical protein